MELGRVTLEGENIKIDVEAGAEDSEGTHGIVRGERNKEPRVTMIVRRFLLSVDGKTLTYRLLMATTTTPKLTPHLECVLHKVAD